VGRAIGEAHAGWLALALFISVATLPFRSWRWTVLLQSVGRVPQRDANVATTIGFAASTLLPARAGEVVRPYVLADRLKLPFAPVLASVAFERLLDLLSVILLFVVYALGWVPSGLGEAEASRFAKLRGSAFLVGAVALVGLLVAVYLARKPERLGVFLRFVPRRIRPRVESLAHAFLSGMGGVHSAKDALVIAGASVFLWLVLCVQVYASLRAFGIEQPFPVALSSLVGPRCDPTPGGVGGYHAAVLRAHRVLWRNRTSPRPWLSCRTRSRSSGDGLGVSSPPGSAGEAAGKGGGGRRGGKRPRVLRPVRCPFAARPMTVSWTRERAARVRSSAAAASAERARGASPRTKRSRRSR
jgi:hypothetical protein